MLLKKKKYIPKSTFEHKDHHKLKNIKFDYEIIDNKLIVDLVLPLYRIDLYWKEVLVKLVQDVKVKRNWEVNKEKVLHESSFTVEKDSKRIVIDLDKSNFSYSWRDINIDLKFHLEIDAKILFNSNVNYKIDNNLKNVKPLIPFFSRYYTPKDKFSIIKSIFALSILKQVLLFWWPLILFFIFYLFWAFKYVNYEIIIVLFWLIQLITTIILLSNKKFYLWFFNLWFNQDIVLWKKSYEVNKLLYWVSEIDLNNVKIRILISNIERGLFYRQTGKSRKKTNLANPVNWIIIYEKKISFLPKNTNILNYLDWNITLDEIYKQLIPRNMITDTHWIDVEWKVQIITKDYINHELILPSNFFDNAKFYHNK